MLTIIVAQTAEDDVINKDDLPPGPSEIPLADDDVETEETAQQPFQPLPAEVPQGQPGVEPIPGLEGEALEPAGEIPAPETPPKPEDEFEKVEVEPSELDVLNQKLTIQQKRTCMPSNSRTSHTKSPRCLPNPTQRSICNAPASAVKTRGGCGTGNPPPRGGSRR